MRLAIGIWALLPTAVISGCGSAGAPGSAPDDASAVAADSASNLAPGEGGGPDGMVAAMVTDGGVSGIYRSCPAIALTQTHSDPHLTLHYPADWTGAAVASNSYGISAPYAYVPTGSSTPSTESASVATFTGSTLNAGEDAQTAVAQTPSGYPDAVIRRFTIGGEPAAAWWYEYPPAQCGACPGPGDPGPDYIAIGVSAVHGTDLVEVDGHARIDAPDSVFCAMESIEASLTLP
jgi:hypothetical protein